VSGVGVTSFKTRGYNPGFVCKVALGNFLCRLPKADMAHQGKFPAKSQAVGFWPRRLVVSMKSMIGRKLGMTQIFKEDKVIPVTVIEAGPISVLRKLTQEKDGYEALQVGFDKKKKGYAKIGEVKGIEGEVGDTISVALFQEGDLVKVSGISKGKGFQGGVKRHGFHGRNATHGVKHEERSLGSTGMRYPQRVLKGRKMPGRMGAERVTVKNLRVVHVDEGKNILSLKGAIPGRPGTLLFIQG